MSGAKREAGFAFEEVTRGFSIDTDQDEIIAYKPCSLKPKKLAKLSADNISDLREGGLDGDDVAWLSSKNYEAGKNTEKSKPKAKAKAVAAARIKAGKKGSSKSKTFMPHKCTVVMVPGI